LNIGDGEIVLILVLLFILAVGAVGFLGLIYLIARAAQNRPPPAPATLPPAVTDNQQRRDREHLRLLSIFHFVFAGLALLGVGFLCVHYAIMSTVFWKRDLWNGGAHFMLVSIIWFYFFMVLMLVTGLVLNVLSGVFLRQKRHRFFSLIVGGLNCLQIPFGTALGVFTIIVLTRDTVREWYSD
jgi:hypothetical protein